MLEFFYVNILCQYVFKDDKSFFLSEDWSYTHRSRNEVKSMRMVMMI